MYWIAALWFVLASYGLANAIAVLKLGQPLRSLARKIPPSYVRIKKAKDGTQEEEPRSLWLDLVGCPPCIGFWIGLALSWYAFSPASVFVHRHLLASVVDGLVASAACYLLHGLAERIFPDTV